MNTTQGTGKGIEEDKLVSKVTAFWKETLDRRECGGEGGGVIATTECRFFLSISSSRRDCVMPQRF